MLTSLHFLSVVQSLALVGGLQRGTVRKKTNRPKNCVVTVYIRTESATGQNYNAYIEDCAVQKHILKSGNSVLGECGKHKDWGRWNEEAGDNIV